MRDKLQILIVHDVFYLNMIYLFFNNLISRFLTWSSGTNELVFRVEPPPWVTTKNNIYIIFNCHTQALLIVIKKFTGYKKLSILTSIL